MVNNIYHIPALLKQTICGLDIIPEGVYIDATFGGGGHSRAIIERLGRRGRLYGFDQDIDAYANKIDDSRFTFVHSNFCFLHNFLKYYNVTAVDGIVADLGVSFHHFDDSSRGFSFRFDGALDMRMNQKATHDAAWILNNYREEKLADIFYLYGELKSARKLAAAIIKERVNRSIDDIPRLLEVIKPFINQAQEKKELAQFFQALRIEVNKEIDVLKCLLAQSLQILKPGGRIAILTYHSLEDRLVKNFFKTGNYEGKQVKDFYGKIDTPFKLINNKVIIPDSDEIAANPRSRSAKLRIAEKV